MFQTIGKRIPLDMLTDSKSIFNTVITSRRLREIRLMNNIAEIRRAYITTKINNVEWVRSEHNYATPFTRYGKQAMIVSAMESGQRNIPIAR